MKVVFFGTPKFAADILEYLIEKQVKVVAVVSKPDRAQGRSDKPVPTAVKQIALRWRLPLEQPALASAPEFAKTLQSYGADLFVVVAYGEIIKQHLLDMPKLGCINVHASLLPRYRGAAPIHRCLIQGEKETGVTIMHMVRKMDAGDIIERQKVSIDEQTTYAELERSLCLVGKELLFQVIQDFERGVVKRTPQDHGLATLAPRIELEECEIHWEQPAEQLHNLIRGTSPIPGAWCYVMIRGKKRRLKIYCSAVKQLKGKPSQILNGEDALIVACGSGALRLLEVKLEGRPLMSAVQLKRGYPDLAFFSE